MKKMATAQHRSPAGDGRLGFALSSGCAAFRASTDERGHQRRASLRTPSYDAADMRTITAPVVDEFSSQRFLAATSPEPPVMMIAGIQNRTNDHIDTKNITDRMRTLIFQTGSVRFINEARRADLLKNRDTRPPTSPRDSRLAIGQQLGAQYMFSGSLTEIKTTSPSRCGSPSRNCATTSSRSRSPTSDRARSPRWTRSNSRGRPASR